MGSRPGIKPANAVSALQKLLTSGVLVALSCTHASTPARADDIDSSIEEGATLPSPEESHPGLLDEAEYAEAVLAYNARKNADAIRILDTIVRRSPGHLSSLEMLALLQKAQGDEKESLATYQKLLKAKPPKERGPYHFEVATLLFKRKNFEKARSFFTYALRLRFNEVACHFFLGLIDLGAKRFNSASDHFESVIASGNHEYSVAAHYYLGVAQFQLGAGTEGTAELLESRDRAREFPKSPLAQQVSKASIEALKPQEGSRWYGTVSVIAQNDSNVQLTPDSVADAQASGKSSPKLTLSGSVGRMSSSLNDWQWVPSFQTVVNRNLNADAAEAQFVTSTLMLFLNRRPLASSTWGLKAAGTSTFQYLLESDSSGSYAPFSATGDFGPYAKLRLARNWKLSLEGAFKPQLFLTDEVSGTSQRSGSSYYLRTSVRTDSGLKSWLKPELSLSGEYLQTQGVDYRGTSLGADFSNTARILGRDALNLGVSAQWINYPDRADGARADLTLTLKTSYIMPLSSSVALLADISWTKNTSNVESLYSYTKFLVGAGVNLSF
jgi:tetratricopeptide (TPR) repeat protein